ncbi:AmmeMemoRadiSam system protein B [Roseovarius salis]|uniref:AmmeMemoRadiSam system protein B n=1 Tax=Roseovarius salis TaxID=3376063 RepID=UPI0037C6CCFC
MNRPSRISTRYPAVAGRFFPATAEKLEEAVKGYLAGAAPGAAAPRAIISPHAGYPFSGRLAGAAWAASRDAAPGQVVVLSPAHQHAFEGVAMPSQDRYAMPGFDVRIDAAARRALADRGLAHVEDAAHDREHGVETQLPFLNALHPDAMVVPLVIGRAAPGQVAQIVDALTGMDTAPPLFVLSSDLSHFLTRDAAHAHDAETARLIETGDHDRIGGAHACGATAIRGFMESGFGRGLRVQRLGMANSAEVTGDTSRTVGYGAWALYTGRDEILGDEHRAALLRAGRQALAARLSGGASTSVAVGDFGHPLQGHGAAFVTLLKDGALRGCIGSLVPRQPLVTDVVDNTLKAGFHDPRFAPMAADELERVTLKIATLSPAAPLRVRTETDLLSRLSPGRDGLVLSDGPRRGVFLPMVWDSLPDPRDFVTALKQKAGLPPGHWSDTLTFERFSAESFGEPA